MPELDELISGFQTEIYSIIKSIPPHEQREALKVMISVFDETGKSKGVPMLEHISEVVNKFFPHLKNDLQKLLVLA